MNKTRDTTEREAGGNGGVPSPETRAIFIENEFAVIFWPRSVHGFLFQTILDLQPREKFTRRSREAATNLP